MKKIVVLGSTGSIGTCGLAIARHLPDAFCVVGLAAHQNVDLLEKQVREFHPKIVAMYDEQAANDLRKRVSGVKVVSGSEGVCEVAAYHEADFILSGIVGNAGLLPTVAAIKAGKDVGLANKEVLVSAGGFITKLAKDKGVNIIPVDSEHSAIFQCLQGQDRSALRRIILTASGGPFRLYTREQLAAITIDQALRHPTWNMGAKVTIDCSTLMNKGFEVIEAYWLFNMDIDEISVVIHPQSIIHSLVDFVDGSQLAQIGEPNMTVPIQYAMTYPRRLPSHLKPFDITSTGILEFYKPDIEKFACLRLAYESIRKLGTTSCFMNAANEVLVHRFLNKEISWNDIAQKLEALMENHSSINNPGLDTILAVDAEARKEALTI